MAMEKWTETMGKYRQVCRLQGKATHHHHHCPKANKLLLGSPKRLIPPRNKAGLGSTLGSQWHL